MEKKEVRSYIRERKKEFSPEEKKSMSRVILGRLEQLEQFQKAKVVLGYWSMEDEVFTHDFVMRWAGKKTMLLPCVKGDDLELRYFDGVEKLCPGQGYAIPEPVGVLFDELERIDLIIVPGVAFDRDCNRLGRGKGYYDRLLKGCQAYKVGVCFPFQYIDQVPVDVLDVKMDVIIK